MSIFSVMGACDSVTDATTCVACTGRLTYSRHIEAALHIEWNLFGQDDLLLFVF